MATRQVPGPDSAPWERPAPAARAARSEAIEQRIRDAQARISDPGLSRLLEGTLPNTLDTTTVAGGTDLRPDTFVVTGDIDAMWLRDSTAQVWPYLASVRDDPGLDRLIRGVIHRQSDQILLDPYANAFRSDEEPSEWAGDETDMRPGVHERKWEPDSLLAFCRLSAGYGNASGTLRPFDAAWRGALEAVLRTLRTEQRLAGASPYRFRRPDGDPTDVVPNHGQGATTHPNGMVHGAFRPSDDASELPLNVPINLALAAALDRWRRWWRPSAITTGRATLGPWRPRSGAASPATGPSGKDRGPSGPTRSTGSAAGCGWMTGTCPASCPCRTSAPATSPTRPTSRPAPGSCRPPTPGGSRAGSGDGVGSPHTGPRRIWPIAVAMRGLTATSDGERATAARLLGASHAGTYLAHESFDPDEPTRFTRPWFAWANSLVGEFLERAALDGLLA